MHKVLNLAHFGRDFFSGLPRFAGTGSQSVDAEGILVSTCSGSESSSLYRKQKLLQCSDFTSPVYANAGAANLGKEMLDQDWEAD